MWKLTYTELGMLFTFETEDRAHAFIRISQDLFYDEPYTLEELDESYHARACSWRAGVGGTVYIRATLNHEPDRDVWVTVPAEFVESIGRMTHES